MLESDSDNITVDGIKYIRTDRQKVSQEDGNF